MLWAENRNCVGPCGPSIVFAALLGGRGGGVDDAPDEVADVEGGDGGDLGG